MRRRMGWLMTLALLAPLEAAAAVPGLPLFDARQLTPYWPGEAAAQGFSPATVPPFALVDQGRARVTEADLRRRVSVVSFFFADCPGICPMLFRSLQRLRARLGARRDAVAFYSLSVQPESDTPARLAAYARARGIDRRSWALLTGSRDVIYRLGKEVFLADGAVGERRSPTTFIHTQNVYLVDRRLRIRGIYDSASVAAMANLARDADRLADESP